MPERGDFLPVNMDDMLRRGWTAPDFVFVSGDAYVDHPSFGTALLARVLEKHGYSVAILAQPDWHSISDFKRFPRPRLGFLVGAGVVDSMVNHYTAAKKPRSEDVYSPGGKAGHRPDRATIVYCNRIREAWGKTPIILGSLEASLRRFAHYDYWEDRVRASILIDSGANLLLYGMCEGSVIEAAKWIERGCQPEERRAIRGACYAASEAVEGYEELPSFEDVRADKRAYAHAFIRQMEEQDHVRGVALSQKHGRNWLCQNPPSPPLTRSQLDAVYALPFTREWHPDYDEQGGVPALEEVKFSITATRGCFGSCAFCALTYHQGRVVVSRSPQSIIREGAMMTHHPDFKGYIHDVGGPTANFRCPACEEQLKRGTCKNRMCMYPRLCRNIKPNHSELLNILRELRTLPGVKKVFIRSGIRFDYLMADPNPEFFHEMVEHHISGQLKVAPEHADACTLSMMGKPELAVFNRFHERYKDINARLGKSQYIVPYFISSHPGCGLDAAIALAEYMRDTRLNPEQVQDFYPTPGTLSTCMYYTGLDPRTMRPVYVPRDPQEKAMQRALMQYRRPQNRTLVHEALRRAGREDLIGYGPHCLVAPPQVRRRHVRK